MNNKKLAAGSIFALVAGVASVVAGIMFQAVNGTFGLENTHNGDCYNLAIVLLLIIGGLLCCVLTLVKQGGFGAAIAAACSGVSLLVFVHECYWYIVDVFVGIDEKSGFDPKFIAFTVLLVVAFLIGEIAVYLKKTK